MYALDTFLGYLDKRIIPDIQQFCNSIHSTRSTTRSVSISVIVFGSVMVLAGIGVAVALWERRRLQPDRLTKV
jgi:hypothetical protein